MQIDIISGAAGERHDALGRLATGLRVHGIDVRLIDYCVAPRTDVFACWGWARAKRHLRPGRHALVMERGCVGDPAIWRSLGWDGTARRARYVTCTDAGGRWRKFHAAAMQPWRLRQGGCALVFGQLPDGPAVIEAGMTPADYVAWITATVAQLRARGFDVVMRPHPRDHLRRAYGARRLDGALQDALRGAGLAVTLNSGAATDAVLAGVPTVTFDAGAVAWDVSAQREIVIRLPEREAWAHQLAWTQWSLDELGCGEFWPHLQEVIDVG